MLTKVLLILLVLSTSAFSQTYNLDDGKKQYVDTLNDNYGALFGFFSYKYNYNSEYFNINVSPGMLYKGKKIEYRFPIFSVSGVKRGSKTYRIGYQAPVNWLLMLSGYYIDKLIYPNAEENYLASKRLTRYFVFLPNSSFNYEVGDKIYVGVATHTDYLFERIDGLDRGILFTPSLGLTFTRDSRLTGRGGFTLSLTYSKFWNFEGANQVDGFGAKISMYGDMNSH